MAACVASSAHGETITYSPSGPTGGISINRNGANNSGQPFPNVGTPVCGSACVSGPTWSSAVTVNMPQFDPSLGTLTRVDLQLTSTHLYGGVIYATSSSSWTGTLNDAGVGGRIAVNTFTSPAVPGPVVFNSAPEGPITGIFVNNFSSSYRSSATRSESQTLSFLSNIEIPTEFIGTGTFPITLAHDPTAQPTVVGNGTNNSLPLAGVSISGAPAGTSYVVPYTFERAFNALNSRVTYTYETIGGSQDNPILPDGGAANEDGEFQFTGATGDGAWFDPPLAVSYIYETDGLSNFTQVGLPVGIEPLGDMQFTISDSTNGSVTMAEGATYSFPTPVSRFVVSGIFPGVDGEDPLAFPTFLSFDQSTVSFTMTPVPEPSTLLLAVVGLVGLVVVRRGRS